MIIIEAIRGIFKLLFYYITRPIIWLVTARDCRHCKYGHWRTCSNWYYNPFGWSCGRNCTPDRNACLKSPWRCKFEKKENTK